MKCSYALYMYMTCISHSAHFNEPANSQKALGKTSAISKCSHLMFKLFFFCNHTSSKSLSPLSSCFVDDVLIQLLPFVHNAFSHCSWTSLTLFLYTCSCIVACPRPCSPPSSRQDCLVATSLVELNLASTAFRSLTVPRAR